MPPEDREDEEGGFFRRFSRRKLAAARPVPEAPPAQDPAAIEAEPVAEPESVDAAYIEALPPIESIGAGSDIKPFLARGVPADLRNAAMRRLWSASPGVRDYLDPAVDYAWDWNAPGGVPGGGGTLSQVRVAQMVKDLIGKAPEPAEEEVASVAQDVAPQHDEAEEPQDETPETLDPVRRSTPVPVQKDPPETTRMAADLTPARRHGGAVPE